MRNEKGFSAVLVLLFLLVVGLAGGIGYYIYAAQKDNGHSAADQVTTKSEEASSTVKFKDDTAFTSAVKQEILNKIANPFVYYQEKILKSDIEDVVVKTTPNRMSDNDYFYILTYRESESTQESGFSFGMNNKIGYWLPGLCDPGGCSPYPEDFQQKYPNTYQAYLDCKVATDANDKDRSNLTCTP